MKMLSFEHLFLEKENGKFLNEKSLNCSPILLSFYWCHRLLEMAKSFYYFFWTVFLLNGDLHNFLCIDTFTKKVLSTFFFIFFRFHKTTKKSPSSFKLCKWGKIKLKYCFFWIKIILQWSRKTTEIIGRRPKWIRNYFSFFYLFDVTFWHIQD